MSSPTRAPQGVQRAPARRPVLEVIADEAAATALADRILDPRRDRPIVVVSTRFDDPVQTEIDVDEVLGEVGDVVDVVRLPTGDLSRVVEARLPSALQVFGGAARSYPIDIGEHPSPKRSPLRFPHRHAAERLVEDALAHALAAGLFDSGTRAPGHRIATGTVRRLMAADRRALVELDDGGLATVWAELTFPPVPLGWAIGPGSRVAGDFDPVSKRLRLDEHTPDDDDVRARFEHRAVTLALVKAVSAERAVLALHPGYELTVHPRDVSPNPLDTPDLLLAEGDVVRVRVLHLSDRPHLQLNDVDDDETVVPSFALVPGGPGWLHEDRPFRPETDDVGSAGEAASDADPTVAVVDPGAGAPAPAPAVSAAQVHPIAPAPPPTPGGATRLPGLDDALPGASANTAPAPARPRPGPGLRPAVAPAPAPAPPAPTELAPAAVEAAEPSARGALTSTQLQLAAARHRILELESRLQAVGASDSQHARLNAELAAARQRAALALAEAGEATRQIAELRRQNKELREQQRETQRVLRARTVAGSAPRSSSRAGRRDDWPDDESWLRHEILLAWVSRVSAHEKPSTGLRAYEFGSRFASSLVMLDEAQFAKALKAVVDVLTGRAASIPGRDMHALRSGEAGNSPDRIRDDGARCWRTAIEQNVASARRLHFWQRTDGVIELSRVVLHDDFEP